MSTKNTHGGPGRGQGRKPLDDAEPTVSYNVKMPASLRDKARAMGADRVRALIDSATGYTATYWHSGSDTPGALALGAMTDADAIAELERFVIDGYRNQTGASITLANGDAYIAQNINGRAVAHTI